MKRQLLLATALSIAAGCDFENVTPGVQSQCATPTGAPLGCPRQPIEDSTDACLKLVGCGAIPVENPEEEIDLVGCIEAIDELEGFHLDFTLNCIEASTCDELKSAPTCFEHGEL